MPIKLAVNYSCRSVLKNTSTQPKLLEMDVSTTNAVAASTARRGHFLVVEFV